MPITQDKLEHYINYSAAAAVDVDFMDAEMEGSLKDSEIVALVKAALGSSVVLLTPDEYQNLTHGKTKETLLSECP